jgi:hypothetical protein
MTGRSYVKSTSLILAVLAWTLPTRFFAAFGLFVVLQVLTPLAGLGLCAVLADPCSAGFIISHAGTTDPTTEGFVGQASNGAPSDFGPIANDLNLPTWRIAGTAQASQYTYISGQFSASQKADIAQDGFTMTVVVRILAGLAPAYDQSHPVLIGAADVNIGAIRYELDLGLNDIGDTVAILATNLDTKGPGSSTETFGQSYTLTGSGSSYNTFALVYDPVSQSADLLVNGVQQLGGYTGYTASFIKDDGLHFAAASGGQADFSFVQVYSVPEPCSLALLGIGALGAIGLGLRSRHVK